MIWLETPTNPLLKVCDIKAIAEAVKKIRDDIILVVDNTFLTCYFQVHTFLNWFWKLKDEEYLWNIILQRPLELGADITFYSLTKYMNGHSDVIMGAAVTKRDDLEKRLRFIQNGQFLWNAINPELCFHSYFFPAMGIVPSPFDCALVNRSLKTLEIRMQQHMKNGLAVAKFLESHPQVTSVQHPCKKSCILQNFPIFLNTLDICRSSSSPAIRSES